MDLGTGRVYHTREDALAAGVSPADLMEVERAEDGTYRLTSQQVVEHYGGTTKPKHEPHQGTRERARRAKRLAAR